MSRPANSRRMTLMLGALGVVFGDIGTSPLYAIKETFHPHIGLAPDIGNILGVLSLIFWLLIVVVSGKYVAMIMRADNKGEGGNLVLHALALRYTQNAKWHRVILVLGLMGSAFFYGDSVITPAISVVSAVEGLEVPLPHISSLVVPISIAILVALFAVQRHGTASIGRFYGPIMLFWFAVLALIGTRAIIESPVVLQALNPVHAISFIASHASTALLIMGAVVLAITGAEAIYADMGHFGRKPIQRAWFYVALPSLVLNYFGQGALLLQNPEAIKNPFFMMAPEWFQIPLVFISVVAAVIASQATITGAFSVTRQAIQLGYLPSMMITHTSEHEAGQIYIPTVNLMMMVSVVLLVLAFKSSGSLAAAYGISVTATMITSTILAFQVTRRMWNWPTWLSLGICIPLLFIDVTLFSANLFKVADGGWLSLLIAGVLFLVMITWVDGSRFLFKQVSNGTIPLPDFLATLAEKKPIRIPGTAIFLVRSAGDTPHALLRNFKHNHVIHERAIVLNITTTDEPRVSAANRVTIRQLPENFIEINARYGFMELPSIPLLLKHCVEEKVLNLDMADTSFLVSRITIIPDHYIGIPFWQAILFKWLHRNSVRAHDFYRIPTNKVLEIGIQVRV